MIGGTGSGKTWFAPHKIFKKIKRSPGARSLAIGTGFQRHVEHVMIRQLEEFNKQNGIPYEMNRAKAVMTYYNEHQILFGSSENPLSMEGPHLDGIVWMDEAGKMPKLAWDVAQRRSAYNKDEDGNPIQILITTVPYFTNWLKKEVYDPWMQGSDSAVRVIICPTSANLEYPQEEIERQRRRMRPENFQIYYEGSFAKAYGLIFPNPDDTFLVVDPFDVPTDWPAFAGHDFGFNNPTTGVWARLSPDDVLYVVAEYEVPDLTLEDHIMVWKSHGLGNIDCSFGDPAEPGLIEVANLMNYPMMKAPNSINYGLDLVYDRLVTGRLKFFRHCSTSIDHKNSYVWAPDPKDPDILLDKPLKPQPAEHMMDALRYLCSGLVEYGGGAQLTSVEARHRQLLTGHASDSRR